MAHIPGPYGPIQILPRGLLGFLQLKNAGQNPSLLSDLLQPTLDLREWLLETNSESVFVSGVAFIPAATGVGFFSLFTVPDGQHWALLDAFARIAIGAGQTLTHRLAYFDGPSASSQEFSLSGDPSMSFGAADTNRGISMVRGRIPILGPGYRVGIDISSINAAAADFPGVMTLRISRLFS